MPLWLVCKALDQVAQVQAMAKVIVFCSWASEWKSVRSTCNVLCASFDCAPGSKFEKIVGFKFNFVCFLNIPNKQQHFISFHGESNFSRTK